MVSLLAVQPILIICRLVRKRVTEAPMMSSELKG
jgi:hypothetical protein